MGWRDLPGCDSVTVYSAGGVAALSSVEGIAVMWVVEIVIECI